MAESDLSCIILAAGKGVRMKTNRPKVLCEILYEPMLSWVLDSVYESDIDDVCVVTGHRHDLVMDYISESGYNCEVVIQKERKGTAHAVMSAIDFLNRHNRSDVLVINGDSPFMNSYTISKAYEYHKENSNIATVISSELSIPTGYGRIIRDENENLKSIVEECDASDIQKIINEINSGAYWFNVEYLLKYLNMIFKSKSGEYYLTSIIKLFIDANLKVKTYKSEDTTVSLGANTPEQLNALNNIAKINVLSKFKDKGIHIPYDEKVIIGKNVQIGEGTMVLSDVMIIKNAKIGKNCIIGPGTNIVGGVIDDNTNVIFKNITFNNEIISSSKIFNDKLIEIK